MKKSQKKWSLGYIIFLILGMTLLAQFSLKLAAALLIGIGIGFVMQKTRFCFVSAFRDPMLVGMTTLTRAVVFLLILSMLGFAGTYWLAGQLGWSLKLNVFPFGIHTIVGGGLFGIGMVLAGGCASGVLVRMGEGFGMQMVAFAGLIIGAIFGEQSLPYWKAYFGEHAGIFLPDVLGWLPAIIIQLSLLIFLWYLAKWWQKNQQRKQE